jgi:hypothetical protein
MLRFPYIYTNLPLMSLASRYKKQKTAWWSLVMTWMLLLLFSWKMDGFEVFFRIAKGFLMGDLEAVREVNTSTIPVIIASVVVSVPLALTLLPILEKILSKQTDKFHIPSTQRLFAIIMITMFREELLARFLPLGIMTQIPLLGGTFSFYLLYLGGNTLWALLHLMSFENKRENWIMVIPVFISGTFFTMIYTAYGFWEAFFAHVLHNMVMLCANYRIRFSPSRLLLSFYHLAFLGIYSLLFFGVRNHSFADFQLIFGNKGINWEFIDYLSLVGTLTTATFLLLELMGYDLERTHTHKEYLLNLVWTGLLLIIAYLTISLTGSHFQESKLIIAVGLAVGITFIEKAKSGSGISRLFWKSQLLTAVLIAIPTTDESTALFLFLPFLLHQLGERVFRLNLGQMLDYFWYSLYSSVPFNIPLRTAIKISVINYLQMRIMLKASKSEQGN